MGPYLEDQVAAGAVEIEHHPLSFLTTRGSSTDYSLRSANAAHCLAGDGEGDITAFSDALCADQKPEGGVGLPDADLVAAAEAAASPRDGQPQAVVRTPTVIVDGKTLQRSSLADVRAAVEAAAR